MEKRGEKIVRSEERKKEKEEEEKKEKKRRQRVLKRAKGPTVDLAMYVYLPKCHENSVYITWKHPKCVFSFATLSLKNQIIEWWK